jgi:hypothetical protein
VYNKHGKLCAEGPGFGRRRRRRRGEEQRRRGATTESTPRRINLNTSYWFYFLLPDLHLPSPFVSKILCRLAASQLSSVQHLRNFPCSSTLHPVFINTSYWFSLFISYLPQPGQSFRGAAAGTFATCAHHCGISSIFQHLILCFSTRTIGFPSSSQICLSPAILSEGLAASHLSSL